MTSYATNIIESPSGAYIQIQFGADGIDATITLLPYNQSKLLETMTDAAQKGEAQTFKFMADTGYLWIVQVSADPEGGMSFWAANAGTFLIEGGVEAQLFTALNR
jgi:hypothetical protein